MTLRPSELRKVADEIARELTGRPVQKVVQPDERTVLLGFPRRWLLLTVSPRFGRMHLLDEKPPGTGDAAPAFCMLLRKHLVGARLEAVTSVEGERAAELTFEHDGERHRLLALFFGTGGRILLLDGGGALLGFAGSRLGPVELPSPRTDEGPPARFDTSMDIQSSYRLIERKALDDAHRASLLAVARRELARLVRLEAQLEGDRVRATDSEGPRRDADLLFAHLAEIPRGASEVTLADDFAEGAPRVIHLDPSRSAKDNATRLYKDAKRRARGRKVIADRLVTTRAARLVAEQRLRSLETASAESLPSLPPPRTARTSARAASQQKAPPYRVYRSTGGREILVGRGAAKNDELTFHVARGDDLWMHTRDVPGAHVIVPTAGGRPVDGETLLDAATLAVHHSPARGADQADVTYTPRKLVRKPRGAAPGLVTIAGGKTLRVRLDEARLRRLLATLVDG